jgi:putative nucleotidyltransferase with HDIG domain
VPRPAVSALTATLFSASLAAGLVLALAPGLHGPGQAGAHDGAAAVLVSLLAAGALGLYVFVFQPRELRGVRRLLLLALMLVLSVAVAKLFLSITLSDHERRYLPYLLPLAAPAMLVATLLDTGLAVVVAVALALLTAFAGYELPGARGFLLQHPLEPLQMATTFLLASLVGVSAVHRAARASRYLRAGGAVAAVTFVSLLAYWLLYPDRQATDPLWMIVAAALAGLLAAVITVGATLILGPVFGITTRMQLMALVQLDHPLLQQLQEQAPGTFHHSVIVGNLAERAADLIGADALLVRVGCYFHDIGKVAKPAYYIENQTQGVSPYDTLSPDESAAMVSNHVRAGVEMARRHRVPEPVRAFIPEHHGTRLVTFFYRKAAALDPATDPEKFRYPGPKPQSRETAIVMLADSVEAVVRSSRDRSPERIEALVAAVVAERTAEGQLDECELTLRDLRTIVESFTTTLRAVYHARIDYPAPAAGERSTVAAALGAPAPGAPALGAPAPLVGPMDGTAPPPELAVKAT